VAHWQEPAELRYRSYGCPPEMVESFPITSSLLAPMKARAPFEVPTLSIMVALLFPRGCCWGWGRWSQSESQAAHVHVYTRLQTIKKRRNNYSLPPKSHRARIGMNRAPAAGSSIIAQDGVTAQRQDRLRRQVNLRDKLEAMELKVHV